MRIERARFLGAGHDQRTAERRGCAGGTKPNRTETPAGSASVQVPKTAGHGGAPFYPQSLERRRRSVRAVMLALAAQQELKRRTLTVRVFPAKTPSCGRSAPRWSRSTRNGPPTPRPTSNGTARCPHPTKATRKETIAPSARRETSAAGRRASPGRPVCEKHGMMGPTAILRAATPADIASSLPNRLTLGRAGWSVG